MTDITPEPPAPEPAPMATPSPIDMVRFGVCPFCEYDLKGLPMSGACPECGTEYQADMLLAPQSVPSALSLCLRYGWPVFPVILFGVPAIGGRGDESLFCCASICLLMIPLNGAAQALILRNHPVMSKTYLKAVSPRVRRLSHIGIAMFIMTVILPLVIFGGCVIIVLASLGSIH